jgi:phosphatidylglycerol:prolipoprotein diacylglycerol transferase
MHVDAHGAWVLSGSPMSPTDDALNAERRIPRPMPKSRSHPRKTSGGQVSPVRGARPRAAGHVGAIDPGLLGAMLAGYSPPSSARTTTVTLEQPATPTTHRGPAALIRGVSAEITHASCALFQEQSPQGLGVTFWFEARPEGDPYDVIVDFYGEQPASQATPSPTAFTATRRISGILPGSGRIAYTARFSDIAPGSWVVTARAAVAPQDEPLHGAGVGAEGSTAFMPFIREWAPGVSIGAWPLLVALGAVLGVGLLGLLASRYGVPVLSTLLLVGVACLVGLAGAKVYYNLQSTERVGMLSFAGLCIQGFVIAAFATIIVGALLLRLPVALLLDLTTPGLMLGMMLGRVGCWRGGCCAGRPTTGRFALWSSDRELGVKRIPVQLLEGAAAGVIGLVALTILWRSLPQPSGVLFVLVIASYVATRQLLFPLRRESRRTRHGRQVALIGAVAMAAVSMVALALNWAA